MRTIQLLRKLAGEWILRTVSAKGAKLSEQDFRSAAAARKAFFLEGDHQPYARMLIWIEGSRPVIVRMGQKPPTMSAELATYRRDVLEAALKVPLRMH
jgi:hypothetical protein